MEKRGPHASTYLNLENDMNETAQLSDLADALKRGSQEPINNNDYVKIADYAATIYGLSVSEISEELYNPNANRVMLFFKGFVNFCGLAVGLSDDDCIGAFDVFFLRNHRLAKSGRGDDAQCTGPDRENIRWHSTDQAGSACCLRLPGRAC